jgi:phage gp46-like protein
MADMAFTYENGRGFSDIQIVGGDFLLCDTGVSLKKSAGVYYPNEIIVYDPWSSGQLVFKNATFSNSRPTYDDVSQTRKLAFEGIPAKWTYKRTDFPGFDVFTNDSDSLVPPPYEWNIGSLGADPITLEHVDFDAQEIESVLISSLQVSVEISLFTDRRATSDEIASFQRGVQGRTSRRGYWANSFREYVQGSGIWLLDREKRQQETLARAQTYAFDSLAWMTSEGIAQQVLTTASFDGEILILDIVITKPDGQDIGFKYNFAWDSLEVV